jgi:RND family efflux transporter MFP subunit
VPLAPLAALVLLALPVRAQQGPTPVRVDPVVETELQARRLVTGDVVAKRRSRVAAEESGRLLALEVDEGEHVEAGAVLARLDGKRLELDLVVLEAQAAVAQALVRERESDLERETRELKIVEDLIRRNAASQKEVDDARTAHVTAEARLAQARAEIDVLDARTALLRDRIADLEVKAPFAGVVATVDAEAGEWLDVGAPVVDLVSDDVEAWLQVPQRYLAALREPKGPIAVHVGDAEILAADGPDGAGRGASIEVADWRLVPIVDPGVRMLTVIAPLPAGAAAPGMSVRAWVPVGERERYATVASSALLRNETGPYVILAVPRGEGEPHVAMPAQVEVLWREGNRAVVPAGTLEAGAKAIVEGNRRLYPMTPVRPVETMPAPSEGGEPRESGEEGEQG